MRVFCASCAAPSDSAARECAACHAPIAIGGRYALTAAPTAGSSVDEVDSAFPVRPGVGLEDQRPVSIRLAPAGDSSRLEREATVLRGLRLASVPRVLDVIAVDGVGSALVTSRSTLRTLEEQVAAGLRTDAAGARRLLEGLLGTLAQLHGLSPPVFHRNLNPGTVCWDGMHNVELFDFARATDTVEDVRADLVLARPGYQPPRDHARNPVEAELYGVGATVVTVLARKGVETMSTRDGVPDFRPHVRVDDALAQFLDRLLGAGTRRAFASAQDALDTLRTVPGARGGAPVALALAAAAMVILGAGGAGYMLLSAPPPAPQPPQAVRVAPTPPQAPTPRSKPVPAPAPEPEDTKPDAPARPHPVTTKPPPVPVVPRVDDRVLRLVATAIEKERGALVACNVDNTDRVRARVDLERGGTVQRVEPQGRSQSPTTRCVAGILGRISVGDPKADGTSADVWVYFTPSFKIAVY